MKVGPKKKSLFQIGLGMLIEPVSDPANFQRSDLVERSIPSHKRNNFNLCDDAGTLYNKARRMVLGVGCSKDFVGAHYLLERVLQLETSPSELRGLALIFSAMNFIDGRGIRADPSRALELLGELDRIDSCEGGFNLGLFFEGRFGPIHPINTNFDLAAFFYTRSARRGNLSAQTNLGLLLIQNHVNNYTAAIGLNLLQDSAKRGDRIAAEAIKKLCP